MKKYLLYLMIIIGSCFLLNNNVSAYTVYQDSNVTIDEEYIYNTFLSNYENFNLDDFPYISCNKSSIQVYCKADAEELFNNYYLAKHESSYGYYSLRNYEVVSSKIYFTYVFSNQRLTVKKQINTTFTDYAGSSSYSGEIYYSNSGNKSFTNYNPSLISGISSNYDSKLNVLDFSEYLPEPTFNENIFSDDENFKEICVEKGKKYAITSTNIDPISNTLFVSDFFWFPGKVTGIKYSEYDSLNDNNILIFNDDISTENYYFENRKKIDSFYNDDIISNYFIHSGYTDKYSYYGYTAYKFIHSYYVDDDNNPQNVFTIFDFSNINFIPFIDNYNSTLNYCFYIKNEFNVTELKNDEWNDYTGTVPTPGGDLDVNTSYNKNNRDVNSKFLDVTNFLESMSGTIAFVNSYIFMFYSSMPLALRGFILTALVVLIIILIMKIGGYK